MNTQETHQNVKGLIMALLIAVAVSAIRAVTFDTTGHYVGFNISAFLSDAAVTGAFGSVIGFYTHQTVVVGGSGIPGISPMDPNAASKVAGNNP